MLAYTPISVHHMCMVDPYLGPVQLWQPTEAQSAQIAAMLESEDPLRRAYGEAYRNACYICEFGSPAMISDPERGLTGMGDMHDLVELEFRYDTEIDPQEFGIGDMIDIGMIPCVGDTRVERVHDGIRQILSTREAFYAS